MRLLLSLLSVGFLLGPTNALYFFLESNLQRCFYEELPKDTLVVGSLIRTSEGRRDLSNLLQATIKPSYGTNKRAPTP